MEYKSRSPGSKMFWTIQMCMQVLLLSRMVSANSPPPGNIQHEAEIPGTEEDNRFLVIKGVDGIFTYLEESISYLVGNVTKVVNHVDTVLKFIINTVSTIVDILIRQPATVFNNILYAVIWIVNILVYMFLDIVFHTVIKGTCLCLVWLLTSVLTLIINVVSSSLFGVRQFLRTFVLAYLNVFTFIFVYFIMPLFESVFWALSILAIIIITLWAIFEIWHRVNVARVSENWNDMRFVPLCIPLGYAVFNIWMIFCSVILKFICYPVLISAYSFCVGNLTYLISIFIFDKCKEFVQGFDQEQLITRVKYVQTTLKRTILKKLGRRAEKDKLLIQEDVDYCDKECIICFEEKRLVRLFPCEHKVMCFECTVRVLENDYRCPICRATIRYYVPYQ